MASNRSLSINDLVDKMLGCGHPDKMGDIKYRCLPCEEDGYIVVIQTPGAMARTTHIHNCAAVWRRRDARHPVQPVSCSTIGEQQGGIRCPGKLSLKRTPQTI